MEQTKGKNSGEKNNLSNQHKIEANSQFPIAGNWNQIKPPLSEPILKTLSELNFSQMTPVQAATIPLFLNYKDVIVEVNKI